MSVAAGQPPVSVIIPAFNRREETLACVESVLASAYPAFEVIVVDNGSSDGTGPALVERFGERIRVVRSEVNLFAGGGRNLGATRAKGDFLLFVDSDNVVDPGMMAALVEGVAAHPEAGIGLAGPFMYYHEAPDRLCWVRGDINFWTSLTWWTGQREKDGGQYAALPYVEVGHIPNAFLIRRELFDRIGGFDPLFRMHYEESDLAERIKRLGFRCALFPKARTWHRIPFQKPKGDRQFSGANRELLYLSVRNRILFMKRHASRVQVLLFFLVFSPALLAYQLLMMAWNGRFALWGLVLRGYRDGWRERVGRGA